MLDAQNPFLYYLVPTSDGQSMTMISVPADHHDPNAMHGMSGLQATSLAFAASGAMQGDGSSAQSLANGFLPPGIVIAPRPEYAMASSAGGDPLLGSVQVTRASDLHHLNSDDMGSNGLHGQSTPRAVKTHRPDIPNCTACGAYGKQLGRQGSRVKIDCCLCANCEDRIKRFKKDGFRKGNLLSDVLFLTCLVLYLSDEWILDFSLEHWRPSLIFVASKWVLHNRAKSIRLTLKCSCLFA